MTLLSFAAVWRANFNNASLTAVFVDDGTKESALTTDEVKALENIWRSIFGPKNKRGKDLELILRFLAFRYMRASYKAPMKAF
jgi:hypothetical protein